MNPEYYCQDEPWKIAQKALQEAGLAMRVIGIEELRPIDLSQEVVL